MANKKRNKTETLTESPESMRVVDEAVERAKPRKKRRSANTLIDSPEAKRAIDEAIQKAEESASEIEPASNPSDTEVNPAAERQRATAAKRHEGEQREPEPEVGTDSSEPKVKPAGERQRPDAAKRQEGEQRDSYSDITSADAPDAKRTSDRASDADVDSGSTKRKTPKRGSNAKRAAASKKSASEKAGDKGVGDGWSRSARPLGVAAVLAAAVIAVCVNILAARFYKRWDWTSSGLYTLSDATQQTLRSLDQPIDVIVFLSRSDPLTVSVQHMLQAYGNETSKLRARYVDPDRSPGEFVALQKKYGIEAGKAEDGRVVTDASIVVAKGDKHWFITTSDMVVYDEQDGRARPKLEQALTEGIRNVIEKRVAKVCFTRGHQELSIDDGGPEGLAELKFRIKKDNYEPVAVDLVTPQKKNPLLGCQVVVVAGPQVKVAKSAVQRLDEYVAKGGNLLMMVNPIVDDEARIQPTGLEPVAQRFGIDFGLDFVVEGDDRAKLPMGLLGETFFVTPKPHAITKGLVQRFNDFRVVVSAAQSLRPTANSSAQPLLSTSEKAFGVKDIRPFVSVGKAPTKSPNDSAGPLALAMAAELPKTAGGDDAHGSRCVVIGSANVAWGRNWRESTLLGNRLLVESALAWLAAKPPIVSVPEKASHDVGINITEDSLDEVRNYVLIYMPGAAALLGLFILFRRRQTERKSRRDVSKDKS